jgi:hypothetical protein
MRMPFVKVRANRTDAPIARAPSVPSLHWGNGKEGNGGALGMNEVAHLPTHPGEEQCALDEGKSAVGRLGDQGLTCTFVRSFSETVTTSTTSHRK